MNMKYILNFKPPYYVSCVIKNDKSSKFWLPVTCQGLMNLSGRPVAAFDPEGLIFAAGVNSEHVKLYDLRYSSIFTSNYIKNICIYLQSYVYSVFITLLLLWGILAATHLDLSWVLGQWNKVGEGLNRPFTFSFSFKKQ